MSDDTKILPKRIRELIGKGDADWTFRVNTCRCAFEEIVITAKTSEKAAQTAEQNPNLTRMLRFTTSPVVHSVEVLFEEEWFPIWKVGDK